MAKKATKKAPSGISRAGYRKPMKIDGMPVFDATEPVHLIIDDSDIKRGNSNNPSGCAAALAAVRQIGGVREARVHLGRVYLKIKEGWLRFETPRSLRTEIVAFDRGGRFVPGAHDLLPPPPSHRLNHDRHANKQNKPTGTGKAPRQAHHVTSDVRVYAR